MSKGASACQLSCFTPEWVQWIWVCNRCDYLNKQQQKKLIVGRFDFRFSFFLGQVFTFAWIRGTHITKNTRFISICKLEYLVCTRRVQYIIIVQKGHWIESGVRLLSRHPKMKPALVNAALMRHSLRFVIRFWSWHCQFEQVLTLQSAASCSIQTYLVWKANIISKYFQSSNNARFDFK